MRGRRIAGLLLIQHGGRKGRGGNLLLLDDTPGREALLKVYRRRGSALSQGAKRFSYRVIERKRGVTPAQRCTLERRHLALWRKQGFDVPALIERPLPEPFAADPASWMEYCPGPLLYDVARNAGLAPEVRRGEVARFGAALGDRQARTLEVGDRGLVMKHASIKHVLVCGERQVSFDLEGSYADSWPLLDALADELGANLRSLLRVAPEGDRETLGEALIEGYGRRDQALEIADFGIRRGGIHRGVRRFADRRRRSFAEYDALRWLEARLGG